MKEKFYITTPIYYASGEPHIGHAFATLYSDVIARFKRLQGQKVLFVTGMDEHGSKIAEAARLAGKSPAIFVDEIAKHYLHAWDALEIQRDDFIRTTSQRHIRGVLKFMERLYRSGDIYPDFYEGLYCVGCENFITEKDLLNGLCPNHLQSPIKIKEKNYFFNFKKYLPTVKQKILQNELHIIPEVRKNEILNILKAGIPNFSITRDKRRVQLGIPFPYDQNQTIYVWAEALMNYVTVLDFPDSEKFLDFWPADVHIIGTDINKFHSIFWPALLLAINLPLPKSIFVHGLFTVNGQKMSKTLGNVIDPIDIVDKFGVDATRYLLLSQFSAIEHGNIKASEFVAKYNSDLANGVGNLLERVFAMIINYRNGVLKNKLILEANVESLIDEVELNYYNHMENYLLFEALKDIFSFIKSLDVYINEEAPWNLYKNKDPRLDIVLNSLFFSIEKIVQWFEPFMPSKVDAVKNYIAKMLGGTLKRQDARYTLNLFPRIQE